MRMIGIGFRKKQRSVLFCRAVQPGSRLPMIPVRMHMIPGRRLPDHQDIESRLGVCRKAVQAPQLRLPVLQALLIFRVLSQRRLAFTIQHAGIQRLCRVLQAQDGGHKGNQEDRKGFSPPGDELFPSHQKIQSCRHGDGNTGQQHPAKETCGPRIFPGFPRGCLENGQDDFH